MWGVRGTYCKPHPQTPTPERWMRLHDGSQYTEHLGMNLENVQGVYENSCETLMEVRKILEYNQLILG